jgi:hypothetical protein
MRKRLDIRFCCDDKGRMDAEVKLIFEAAQKAISHPEDRRAAIIRAGLVAQAYIGLSNPLLTEVFGSEFNGAGQNHSDLDGVLSHS